MTSAFRGDIAVSYVCHRTTPERAASSGRRPRLRALVMPRAASFVLKPEWRGPCARSATIDVNLGHTPEAFVDAAHYQITGEPAPPALVRSWSERLRRDEHVRRIDVVRALCDEHRRPG